jgi:hypothetical protein
MIEEKQSIIRKQERKFTTRRVVFWVRQSRKTKVDEIKQRDIVDTGVNQEKKTRNKKKG